MRRIFGGSGRRRDERRTERLVKYDTVETAQKYSPSGLVRRIVEGQPYEGVARIPFRR